MPSLNQGAFIEEAILSVLTQNVNAELIIIDGGSNDQTGEILKKYSSQVSYWRSEKDHGQSDAINKGLRQATGGIVTWLNSDDTYEPEALKKVQTFFSTHPDIDLLHGRSVLFGNKKELVVGPAGTLERWEYLPYMRFPQPSSFFRRSALDKILPVNVSLHYAMDHELVVKGVLQGLPFQGNKEIFSRYRLHTRSKSMNEMLFMKEWSTVFAGVLLSAAENSLYERFCDLGLHDAKLVTRYPATTRLSDKEITRAYLEHLHLRFHGAYRQCNLEAMVSISAEISRLDPSYAHQRQYQKYITRTKFIPKWIFDMVRKVNR
jgi:glycosyltransferase involved in cell wall biosynthesis